MRATFYVVTPKMVKGRRHFVFDVAAYTERGGRLLTVRRFTTVERATQFAGRARNFRAVFPVTAVNGQEIR